MTLLFWEDSTSASGLQAGMYGYGGYWNGPYHNIGSIKARFPGKPVMGYATRVAGTSKYPSMQGADAIDCEPGTVGSTFAACAPVALAFIKGWKGGSGLFNKPLVYCFASWLSQMEDYLAARGIPRSRYYINSSHATGVAHFCGPKSLGGCGFGRSLADMTQYKFAGAYDKSVSQSYMLKGSDPIPDPPVTGTKPVLKNGDQGTPVRRVQQRLYNLKYLTDLKQLDGQFGPATEAAVKAFQKAAGFAPADQDGIVGPKTWTALSKNIPNPAYKPPAPAPVRPPLPSGVPSLRLHDSGTDVKNLQWWLSHSGLKGVRGITEDGNFGTQTDTALRNFQGYANLTPDGVFGPKTRAALSKVNIV